MLLSIISLTDKPAGTGDANLQLLLRPVRLGAVDPSQGVLLARGVRSFRISHSSRVIVSRCRVFVVGTKKEDNKKCSTSEEGTLFREHEKSFTCSFSFIILLSKRRQKKQKAEKSEFFSFFFAPLFRCTARSSFSLFFSLSFSLFSLSSSLCVFFCSRILSTKITFWRRLKAPSNHRNLSSHYIKVNTTTRFSRFT